MNWSSCSVCGYIRRSHSSSGQGWIQPSLFQGCVCVLYWGSRIETGRTLVEPTVFQTLNLFCIFKLQNSGFGGGGGFLICHCSSFAWNQLWYLQVVFDLWSMLPFLHAVMCIRDRPSYFAERLYKSMKVHSETWIVKFQLLGAYEKPCVHSLWRSVLLKLNQLLLISTLENSLYGFWFTTTFGM